MYTHTLMNLWFHVPIHPWFHIPILSWFHVPFHLCSHSFMVSCSHAQLCIIVNNMYHLQQFMEDMSESPNVKQYYQWLEEQDKTVRREERVAKTARSLIGDIIKNTVKDIQKKVSIIIEQISDMVRP